MVGPMYFSTTYEAARIIREVAGCRRVRSYRLNEKLVNVCADGSRLIMRLRYGYSPRRGEIYVVLDWVIRCWK